MRRPSIVFPFALLLGLVALARGLQIYNDRETERARREATPIPRPGRVIPPPPPAEATVAELAQLAHPDHIQREIAASLLRGRAITPELQAAVDRAYDEPANASLRSTLACIKARYPGDAGLDFAIDYVSGVLNAGDTSRPHDLRCVVEVLSERAAERPHRTFDVLYRVATGNLVVSREPALGGLRRLGGGPIPDDLRARCFPPTWQDDRKAAIRVAMALGAIDKAPDIVRAAVDEPQMRSVVRSDIVESPLPAAAWIVAEAAIAQRQTGAEDQFLTTVLREREYAHHDISPVLVDIALDSARPQAQRQTALEILAAEGDPGAAPLLAPLRTSEDRLITSYAEAAIVALDRKFAAGTPRRELPKITR